MSAKTLVHVKVIAVPLYQKELDDVSLVFLVPSQAAHHSCYVA